MERITLVKNSYDELMGYILNRLCEMDEVDISLDSKMFIIGALTALEDRHEAEMYEVKQMRYGKPFKDYNPCEECNASDCGSCDYYGAGNERKTDQDDSGE